MALRFSPARGTASLVLNSMVRGPAGPGGIAGGVQNDFLVKNSSTNYDASWVGHLAAKAALGLEDSTTDNAVIRADGTTGNTQNSGVVIDDNNNIAISNDAKIGVGQTDASNSSLSLFAKLNSAVAEAIKIVKDGVGSAGSFMFGDPTNLTTTITTTGGTTQEFRFPKFGYTSDDFGRLYTAYLEINEPGNPAQLGLTSFNGTFSAPTTLTSNAMVGRIWFRPYLGSGSYWGQDNTRGRSAEIYSFFTDTAPSSGGTLGIATAYPGEKGVHEVASFYSSTNFVHFGRAGNSNVSGASASLSATNYAPAASFETMTADINTQRGFAMLRTPSSGHDAADRGLYVSYVDSENNISVPAIRFETRNVSTYSQFMTVSRDTPAIYLGGAVGNDAFRITYGATNANRWAVSGGTSGNPAVLSVSGEANGAGKFLAGGTGGFTFANGGDRTITITPVNGGDQQIAASDGNLNLTSAGGTSTRVRVVGVPFQLAGDMSMTAWTTSGARQRHTAATLTDTSSSGTVAAAYSNHFPADTIAASSATTFTNYYGAFFSTPTAGTNVTLTNVWALGAGSANITGALRVGTTIGISSDVLLNREAANVLSLKNGTSAQEFRVYNSATSGEYGIVSFNVAANRFDVGTVAGSGALRDIQINGNRILLKNVNGQRWILGTDNSFGPADNNAYDLGTSTAKVRDIYVGRDIYSAGGGQALIRTSSAITSGAGVATGTLTNAPVAGNPTKWIPINDNGTTRYIPAW